jgi:glycerate-2-kinase
MAIAGSWRAALDIDVLVREGLAKAEVAGPVDVVALGKAAPELAAAAVGALEEPPSRVFIATDEDGSHAPCLERLDYELAVGEHPVPDAGSLRAGRALLEFLESPTLATTTLILVSGGASSLCVAPVAPIEIADVQSIWRAALLAGFDITELNTVRSTTSEIAGGGLLGHVRTSASRALVMVDNVVSGAQWVASGLTYEHRVSVEELDRLLERLDGLDDRLVTKIRDAHATRAAARHHPTWPEHRNEVLVEPAAMLEAAAHEARARGYEVLDLGARVTGSVEDVAAEYASAMKTATSPTCAIGVGEASVLVLGTGAGGRCQELAWHVARGIEGLDGAAFCAVASDGADHVTGVGGATCDATTFARARDAGIDVDQVAADNDTNRALGQLGELLVGTRTGWNLCDLYVACVS